MDSLISDIGTGTTVPIEVILGRLFIATVLGAAVGFEREWTKRPAGFRTHILICIASATVAILTIEITGMAIFNDNSVTIDPVRLIEAVTAGVAFLAAGMIVFAKGEIHGLTTGAGMWLAGSIGLACGLGFWQIALIATILALAVLWLMRIVEKQIVDRENANTKIKPEDAEG